MPRLPFPVYLDHLRADSARFRAVLAGCPPTSRVPACPDWDADDLLWHLAEVQWFWARVVTERPASPGDWEPPARPRDRSALLSFCDAASAGLADALAAADPEDAAWTWSDDRTVGFSYRRQAHEALIHRLDAEQTAGEVTPLDTALAADGVAEVLEAMYGGTPPDGVTFTPTVGEVALELTDLGVALRVQPGRLAGIDPGSGRDVTGPHLVVVPEPVGAAAATVSGTAADLDAWLWRRRDRTGIEIGGDAVAYDAFRAATDVPID